MFGVQDGRLTCQYSRTYVEQAQEFPEVPRLTSAQHEALDLLAEVAEEVCLYSPFVPGDIQLLNNHVIFHGRTAYEDDAVNHQERLLFRLWLSMPNSRRLPRGFEAFWGSTRARRTARRRDPARHWGPGAAVCGLTGRLPTVAAYGAAFGLLAILPPTPSFRG